MDGESISGVIANASQNRTYVTVCTRGGTEIMGQVVYHDDQYVRLQTIPKGNQDPPSFFLIVKSEIAAIGWSERSTD